MSTHTPDSRRRHATPRQIARAVRRGPAPASPRPLMPHIPTVTRTRVAVSVEPDDAPDERAIPIEEEMAHRWGPAVFVQQDAEDVARDRFGWVASVRERLPVRSPYSWRERDWRASAWASRLRALPIVAAILVAMVVVGTFAFVVASRAASSAATRLHTTVSSSTPPSSPGGFILQQPQTGNPTPAAPAYTIGAWVTTYGPAAGGTEQVYVRVSLNDNPVKDVNVTLSVSWSGGASPYGPVHTDSYGLASFHISVNGPPGQPEFVTASASIGHSSITADTTFVPA